MQGEVAVLAVPVWLDSVVLQVTVALQEHPVDVAAEVVRVR